MQIITNFDLTNFNTFHLSASAMAYLQLTELNQLTILPHIIKKYPKFLILGGGSNVLLPKFYNGLVIHNQLRGVEFKQAQDNYKIIAAMAGECWDDFVATCLNHNAYGLENLSLIPGTVGAAPIQNIGAYGVEVKDFIDQVYVFDLLTAEFKYLSNQGCQFSYRNSLFKQYPHYLLISVSFKLLTTPQLNTQYGDIANCLPTKPSALDLRQCIIKIRQQKLPDPKVIGNVGSFFHNPILANTIVNRLKQQYPLLPVFATTQEGYSKISAGWLLDNLGLKGYRVGNLGVYPKQALVLVNYANATQDELLAFASEIQAKVKQHYQLDLNIEPGVFN